MTAQPTPTGVERRTVADGRVVAEQIAGQIVGGRGDGVIGGGVGAGRGWTGSGRAQVHGTLGTTHVILHGL